MNDSADDLRALLADLDGPPGPRGGVTASPSDHSNPLAATLAGRQDTAAATGPASAADPSPPHRTPSCAPLVPGDVVRWSTSRAAGYGQLQEITPGRVVIRPFLPARSHTVRAAVADVERVCSLDDLTFLLARL